MAQHRKNPQNYVTLKNVADYAGVSTKTVSRVVNDQGELSEATRERVKAAIKKLGYQPNMLARSLVNGQTKTLAAVVWGIDYFGPSQTIVGVERKAEELGCSLFLHAIGQPDDTDVGHILEQITARRVDGIVWAVPEVGENRVPFKRSLLKQLPPIVFMSMKPRPGLDVVAINNRDGAIRAVQHLIDQGRRKIGLIAGPLAWWEARERYAGWKETLERSNMPVSPSLVIEGDRSWSAGSGANCIHKLLAQVPDLDAVFVGNDQMALGAMYGAHQLGRRISQDIAFVGYDDIPESAFFWPSLTTIHQPLFDVGYKAVEILHQLIKARRQNENGHPPMTTFISPELVARSSSG